MSVANLTRQDGLVSSDCPAGGDPDLDHGVSVAEANEVLEKLRTGQILGAAVLQPWIST